MLQNQNIVSQPDELFAVQSFSKKLTGAFSIFALVIVYVYPIRQILNHSFTAASLIPAGIVLLIVILFASCKLSVRMTNKYISYRFFPFHLSSRKISKEDILKIELSNLEPISNFGGYGIRYDIANKRWAYLVRGNNVLILTKVSGEQIVLGVKFTPDEISKFLYQNDYPS